MAVRGGFEKCPYLYQRALNFIATSHTPDWMERIFIDQGSPASIAEELSAACHRRGIRYLHLDRGHHPFSIGLCRNTGVQRAHGEFISFQDVDLAAPAKVYEQIRNHLTDDLPLNHLEVIPCLYLTPAGSALYVSRPGRFFGRFLNKSGDLARQDLRASRGV